MLGRVSEAEDVVQEALSGLGAGAAVMTVLRGASPQL
jgi:hypothetical protein